MVKIHGDNSSVQLKLVMDGNSVVLAVVDNHGHPELHGELIRITQDLRVLKSHEINPKFGFKRDGMTGALEIEG